jgi:hypothetical protein
MHFENVSGLVNGKTGFHVSFTREEESRVANVGLCVRHR